MIDLAESFVCQGIPRAGARACSRDAQIEALMILKALSHRVRDLRRQFGADCAQDLLEYAMLASLIAIVAVGAITTLGQTIDSVLWQAIAAAQI